MLRLRPPERRGPGIRKVLYGSHDRDRSGPGGGEPLGQPPGEGVYQSILVVCAFEDGALAEQELWTSMVTAPP